MLSMYANRARASETVVLTCGGMEVRTVRVGLHGPLGQVCMRDDPNTLPVLVGA